MTDSKIIVRVTTSEHPCRTAAVNLVAQLILKQIVTNEKTDTEGKVIAQESGTFLP